ncbi:hypothetical protein [Nitrincola tapanii]|uniref:Uncharacterized protein n=1 Tax=Nitrincola tapanii TaxID=1708751 RepID=A0A5A9W1Q1_9GAMM|nr:hypothetical protein [Nitrincola tapanii]KAA0874720.1 hypothetical protein E1H14_07845 [Nitrincola tapanii]
MPSRIHRWTPEQLIKMNEETFMVEVLDMIKFSPEIDDSDSSVADMKKTLDAVEAALKMRLDARQNS